MIELAAKKYIKEAKLGKKETTLFYLGIIARPLMDEDAGNYNAFAKPAFDSNIKKLGSRIIGKLQESGLEKTLKWAIDGFLESYSDEVEEIGFKEKCFYISSGAAFYGTCSTCGNADEWLSVKEAAEMWEIDSSTIRHSIRRNRFKPGEFRKSGDIWLIRESAMERLYGKRK